MFIPMMETSRGVHQYLLLDKRLALAKELTIRDCAFERPVV